MPAQFVSELRIPGEGDEILRPTALFVDPHHGETFVADSGNNRLVVFDQDGVYRYEFDCVDHVGMPNQIAVDSHGFVYVMGTAVSGRRLLRFDFDGTYLDEIDLEGADLHHFTKMTLDDRDRFFLLDESSHTLELYDTAGRHLKSLDLTVLGPGVPKLDLVYGEPSVHEGRAYVPVSSLGTIGVLDIATGSRQPGIGFRGNTPGQMNFPVAARVSGNGMLLVLDKMRFNVQCFSLAGEFLGEFGGKGFRNGWFYHPSLLAVDGAGRAVVGQILDNRVQICAIPRFIHEKYEELSQRSHRHGDDDGQDLGDGAVASTQQSR